MKTIRRTPRRHRRGVALLAVLWIGALGALLLVGVRHATQVNLATAHAELAAVQAHWLARAGVEQAMAVLQDDDPAVDSPLDLWYRDDALFNNVEVATGTFSVVAPPAPGDDPTAPRYGVHDLGGLVSVNHADSDTLTRLPNVTPNAAASILDWRDPNGDTRTGGAERAYYAELAFPYEIANRPFQTLHELRLVQHIDPLLFYGEDTNLDGVVNPRENDGPLNLPEDDQDGELDGGIAGLVSVYNYELNQDALGSPRINVNEADENELRNQLNFSADLARGVVNARNNGFDSLMDLLNVRPQPERGRGGGGGNGRGNRAGRGGRGGGNNNGEEQQSQGQSASNRDEVTQITLDWLGANLDRLTLNDEERQPARINVNTAPRDVLLSLPQLTEDQADAIIDYRTSASGPFDGVGELRTSRVVDDQTWRAIAERVTVRSNVFQITGVGVSRSGVVERLIAVVDRGQDPMRVLYWYQGE